MPVTAKYTPSRCVLNLLPQSILQIPRKRIFENSKVLSRKPLNKSRRFRIESSESEPKTGRSQTDGATCGLSSRRDPQADREAVLFVLKLSAAAEVGHRERSRSHGQTYPCPRG